MIQTTRWKPDTCDCELEYSWDDSVPQEDRVHALINRVSCKFHAKDDDETGYQKVVEENSTKNVAYGHLLDKMPDLTRDVMEADGSTSKQVKPEYKFDYEFDKDRQLVVTVTGLDAAKAADLTAMYEQEMPGKVEVK